MEPEFPPNQPPPDANEEPSPPPPGADGPDGAPGDAPDAPPAAADGPAVWAPAFQILRSRQDRKLGGVAGGLAAAADLDPTLVRLAVVLGFLTGWGVLAYLIAWAVIPEEDPAKGRYLVPAPERTAKHIRIGLTVAAVIGILHVVGTILGIVSSALIGLGLFPARLFGIGHDRGFEAGEALLGLFLLIGGCLLLFRRHLPWMPAADGDTGPGAWFSGWAGGRGPEHPGQPGAGAPGESGWSGSTPTATGMALATIAPGTGGGGGTAGVYGPPPPPPGSAGSAGGSSGFGARASAAARAARTNGPLLLARASGWLAGLWFLAAAILGGVFWVTGALRVRFPVLPIVAVLAALGVLGYTLLRSRRVAAVIGAMALLLVPTALAAGVTRVDGQAGDRSITPRVASDLDRTYRHAVGALELDLSRLALPAGSRTPIDISMGVGQIEVTVPWDADVESKASVGAGSFDLFGNRQTGVNLKGRTHSTGQPGAATFVISGDAGAGEVIVRRAYEPFTHQALRTGQAVPVECAFFPQLPTQAVAGAGTGSAKCAAADGVTETPSLACVVAASGFGACRPVGEPEPAVDYASDPGTRHCQVPAGGGLSICTPPVPGKKALSSGGSFTCTIPEGGGPAICSPPRAAGELDPNAPAPPASPAPPADPNAPATPATPPPTAAPGEYRCTVPEGGGPANCEPA